MKALPGAAVYRDKRPLPLEFGGELPEIEVAYETWGRLLPEKDNAVLICPAFSAHSHAGRSTADPRPGWWEPMVGPGKAFNSGRYFVICASLLGGCYGTTGPTSIDPRTGENYGGDFPVVSVRDIVDVHMRLIDHLGIQRLHTVVGGSLGGMEALWIAVRHPDRAARIITISGTDRTRPYTATIRHIGRRAIMSDSAFRGGRYGNKPPVAGLRLARELGTIFYRSRREFNERFTNEPLEEAFPLRVDGINFDFESYLNHQGSKAPKMFDANAYLRLSLAMDLHDIARGFDCLEDALEPVSASMYVIGAQEDFLIPVDEQEKLHRALLSLGKRSLWGEVSSNFGHDAFLKEFDWMTPRFEAFLMTEDPADARQSAPLRIVDFPR